MDPETEIMMKQIMGENYDEQWAADITSPLVEDVERGEVILKLSPTLKPGKKWCFTNFFDNITVVEGILRLKALEFIIGEETCPKTLKKHLQGYVRSEQNVRPISYYGLDKRTHWEYAKGNAEQNFKYCSKEGKFITNMKFRSPIYDALVHLDMYPWQRAVINQIETALPDLRTINWIYEPVGKCGKTLLQKHLAIKYNALILSGKGADIRFGVASWLKNNPRSDLKVVCFNFARSIEQFVSYEAIENVKDGIFFNGKYESSMEIFNTPHIFCFSNFAPDVKKLSLDRWKIYEIKQKSLELQDQYLLQSLPQFLPEHD